MKQIGWAAALLIAPVCSAAEGVIEVGNFSQYSQMPAPPWQLVRFDDDIPPTRYALQQHEGVHAVEARAEASMALLARPLTINLQQTPVLCWRWWVDAPIEQADMTRKSGDDYAARVYVTFDLPDSALNLGTRIKLGLARAVHGDDLPAAAINYVWDNRHPVGTTQPNAYTDRAQMLVLQSGADNSGRWIEQRRNLLTDLQQLFEADTGVTRQLAVASDTDNTGATARARFADIHLVPADQPCQFPPQS